jgi:rhamnosyltransferase
MTYLGSRCEKVPSCCAVVTTYNPDEGLSARIDRIIKQVNGVIIIDNHSNDVSKKILIGMASKKGINFIYNKANKGIAYALNQGICWAEEKNYRYVVMLDQDSDIDDDMVNKLYESYENLSGKEKIAIIGSNYVVPITKRALLELKFRDKKPAVEVKTVITSGSFMSLSVFQEIGPFREEFFIDLVDIEYCLRAKAKGFKIFLLTKPVMRHSIGNATMHKLPWKSTGTSHHPAIRRYYMARNHIILAKEYLFVNPVWVIQSLYSRTKSTILMCIFENNRLIKMKYTVLGIVDGLRNYFNRILA